MIRTPLVLGAALCLAGCGALSYVTEAEQEARNASVLMERSPRQALVHADRAAALAPEDPRPHMQRAEILRMLGEQEASERSIKRALYLAPDNPSVVIPVAELRTATGDTEESTALLSRLLARHPDNQDAAWLLGLSRLGAGDAAAAEERFADLVVRADATGSEYAFVARVALATARGPETGVEAYVEAVQLDTGLAVAAARTLVLSGHEAALLELGAAAAVENPEDAVLGFAHASVLQGTGRSDLAVAEVERVLDANPDLGADLGVGLRLIAALSDAERARFGAARERLRAALDLIPAHPQAIQLLATAVFEGRGKPEDIADLQGRIEAARLASRSSDLHAMLDQLEAAIAAATEAATNG